MISVLIFLNKYLISNSIYYLHNLKIMDLNPFFIKIIIIIITKIIFLIQNEDSVVVILFKSW